MNDLITFIEQDPLLSKREAEDRQLDSLWFRHLAARSPAVQALAAEFPIGSPVTIDGVEHRVLDWTDNDEVIVTAGHCVDDWRDAWRRRRAVAASALRPSVKCATELISPYDITKETEGASP